MSYIQEHLYLGDIDDAMDTERLQRDGITHILTLDLTPLPSKFRDDFKYKHVHAIDTDEYDLLSKLDDSLQFVEEGRQSGGILVHCFHGVSRSGTVVVAYVMRKLMMGLHDALAMVTCQRPKVKPNPGFMKQLQLFEVMEYKVDNCHPVFKHYKLDILAKFMSSEPTLGSNLCDNLAEDPASSIEQGMTFYRCRKCRRALFKKSSVLEHEEGIGEQAFSFYGKSMKSSDVTRCTKSLFIEPVQWMENNLYQIAGKLACPKCNAKLGSFVWSGERCCCGTWVTPAFQVQTSKVDTARNTVGRPQQTLFQTTRKPFTKGPCFETSQNKG